MMNILRTITAALTISVSIAATAYVAHADEPKKGAAPAETAPLPGPSEVKKLAFHPAALQLKGLDDSQQLVITGELATRKQDLTGAVEFETSNPGIVRVTTSGRVIPVKNGATDIIAKFGNHSVTIPVKTESCDVDLPINFVNDIVPIFTKLSCNSGGCHGKSGGQNGFALSLLGFVPELDYGSLVHEGRGRRLLPAAPDHSLLLLKATGKMAHGGGGKMEVNSDEYKLVRRWIASGMPYGKPDDPVVTKITVHPERRILSRNNRQQFAVFAHYSDGRVQDVTQRAQYESNDEEIAVVEGAALVRTLGLSGEAAIMARYQANVAVFRATVPLGEKIPEYQFAEQTFVDKHTHNKWKELGIAPSELSNDSAFVRRVYLDLTGTLPTPKIVREFLASKDPKKRDNLIDDLLETPAYAYFFANKWADILRVKRSNQINRAHGTFAFHSWIRRAMQTNMPYDDFVRGILAATGDETQAPATVWYKDLKNPQEFVDDTAQLFLGLRIACAQCHHHPYEKWSQDDYWGLAAFFGRVGRKTVQLPGLVVNNQALAMQMVYNRGTGSVTNKRTGQAAPFKPLDAEPLTIDSDTDPRHKLVDWMIGPKNQFFAKALVNRYWSHFFGRGIVDPLDDMRVTNPPSNPELLDALANEFIKSKFDLKHLVKVICKSRTYQLSAVPNDTNKSDKQAFSRYYPRRMSAEVLLDAVGAVTNSPHRFGGLPADQFAPQKAIMLPDESFSSYFLQVFGKPQRISACECERVNEANLAQALHLLNSQEVQRMLSRNGGRADMLAKDKRPDAEKVEEMFLWAFGRMPSAEHVQVALRHIDKHAANKRVAYENLIWALLNTKEFVFVK